MLLTIHGVDTLCSHRKELTQQFFIRHMQNETCCHNYLLPSKQDITIKLRNTRFFENFKANTKRFLNSFIPYCIKDFQ